MKLRTFTADNLSQALAMVRKDMGPGAMVLHTRTYKRGGLLGLGAKTMVEVTASDGKAVGVAGREASSASANTKANPATRSTPRTAQRAATENQGSERHQRELPVSKNSQTTTSTGSKPQDDKAAVPSRQLLAGELIKKTYQVALAEIERKRGAAEHQPQAKRATGAQAAQRPIIENQDVARAGNSTVSHAGSFSHDQLTEELRAVRSMVGQLMKQQSLRRESSSHKRDMPEKLFEQYLGLLQQEVAEELAEEVMEQVRERLPHGAEQDAVAVREAARQSIANLIPTDVSTSLPAQPADGRPRTIALVGPTGVGKTTTLAKLAATFKLKQHQRVGLITLDTYRIAAVDQLRTYANIIGVPLRVAGSEAELAEAMQRCRANCDVVLIDTAGRSQRDDPRLAQLRSLIHTAAPHEVHLVLSSTCTQAVLLDVVERFASIRTDRIIFTKLDEAVSFGVMINVARKVNKRLSYISTGQEVPHDLEVGRGERLASLLLGEAI